MSTGSILVTGGAGYVGTHTVVELLDAGYDVVVMDNFENTSMESIKRVTEITGKTVPTYSVDLLDKDGLRDLFKKHTILCVMHFAGLKAVGESCHKPLMYYKNNTGGTVSLLEVMKEFEVYNMIFSSSATVYGTPKYLPIDEKHPVGGCTNPYGKTKYFIEELLTDMCAAEKQWNVVILRYFDAVGAHVSGKIGENLQRIPETLMPAIARVSVGIRKELMVHGNDHDTPDGTGVRDNIHVVDLAQGHVAALKRLEKDCGCKVYNLGRGHGYSVFEMVKAFENASGKPVPYKILPRKPEIFSACYVDAKLAEEELEWKAKLDLQRMCEDLWRWQSNNPNGYTKDS